MTISPVCFPVSAVPLLQKFGKICLVSPAENKFMLLSTHLHVRTHLHTYGHLRNIVNFQVEFLENQQKIISSSSQVNKNFELVLLLAVVREWHFIENNLLSFSLS